MSNRSNLKGVGAVKILCRQPGASFNITEIISSTGSSLSLLPLHSASPPRGIQPSVCPWIALQPPGHSSSQPSHNCGGPLPEGGW